MVQSTTQLLYFKVFITCIHNYIHSLCSRVIGRVEHHRTPILRTPGSLPLRYSPGLSGEGEPTPAPRCARLPLLHAVGDSPARWAGTGPASEPGEVARQRGRGRRAVAYRRDTAPAGDDGRRRGRAARDGAERGPSAVRSTARRAKQGPTIHRRWTGARSRTSALKNARSDAAPWYRNDARGRGRVAGVRQKGGERR
ncbi:hypothetical protein DSECCO2_481090 [anaerobic digester metagenome]